jgi:hydrogenase-4 component F
MAFGEPHGSNQRPRASFLPVGVHLALVLVAGIWLPPALVEWFRHVARLLS